MSDTQQTASRVLPIFAEDASMGDELEWVSCEICGSDERELLVCRPDLLLGGTTAYQFCVCQQCGVFYLHPRPRPAAMARHYPAHYQPFKSGVQADRWLFRHMRRYGLRKRCRMITRHIRAGGRLLDVGCGTGDFLSEMQQQRGWSVMGLEPARHAARYAHDEEGLSVLAGVLNQAPLADQSFDAITFWDVLEHVYHPRAVIAEAARLLRPGGVLVINHPNIESLDRRIFGRYWLGYELPRHLYLFPAALLRQLMAEQGLYEVEQRCLYGSYSATISSLQFLLSEYLGRSHSDRLVNQVLLSMPLRFLAAPIFGVIDRQGLGSNITVVFRKRHELSRVGCDDTGFYV